jgi:hypothetical protein
VLDPVAAGLLGPLQRLVGEPRQGLAVEGIRRRRRNPDETVQ